MCVLGTAWGDGLPMACRSIYMVHGYTMHRWEAVGAVMTEGMTLHMYWARRMLNDNEVWMGMRH